jgi:hypothetical protein
MEKSDTQATGGSQELGRNSDLESVQREQCSHQSLKQMEPTVTDVFIDGFKKQLVTSKSEYPALKHSSAVTTIDVTLLTPERSEKSFGVLKAATKYGYLTPPGSVSGSENRTTKIEAQVSPASPVRKRRRISSLDNDETLRSPSYTRLSGNSSSVDDSSRTSSSCPSTSQQIESPSDEILDANLRQFLRRPLKEAPSGNHDKMGLIYIFKEKMTNQPLSGEGEIQPNSETSSRWSANKIISRSNPNKPIQHNSVPTLFKVGYTSGEFNERKKGIQKKCKMNLDTIFYTLELPSLEARRLEKLIQIYLESFNTKYLNTYQQACNCSAIHEEWFHISIQTLVEAIDMWHAFILSKPYHPDSGKLLPFWAKKFRLKDFKYQPQDQNTSRDQKDGRLRDFQRQSNHANRCKTWTKVLHLDNSMSETISRCWPLYLRRLWQFCILNCILFFIATTFGPFYFALNPYTRGVWGHCYVAFVWAVLGFNPIQTLVYAGR